MRTLAAERRAARERALGLLYEAESKGTSGAEVLADLPVPADDFASVLVAAVDEHRGRIDELLERFSQGWTVARMPALDRAALRMGSAELLVRPDVPTGVVLSEVVDLVKRFSTDGSARFVNGLLARVATEVRPELDDELAQVEATPSPLVEGLIIDLDGVIRHWSTSHHEDAEARLGLPAGALGAVAMEPDRLARATDGRLPFEAWCEEIGAELARLHRVDATAAAEAWATSAWQIDLAVMELLEAVRSVVPVALLSNASTHLLRDLELAGIADAFDAVVGSADLGVAKPEAAAFHAAADRIGVPLERCAFVDDTLGHVEAARALGLRAEQFTDVEALRAILVDLRLLP